MTPEQTIIEIAEACGYSIGEQAPNGVVEVLKHGRFHTCFTGKRIKNPTLSNALEKRCLPPYLTDLNVWHTTEKLLTTNEQKYQYADRLFEMTGGSTGPDGEDEGSEMKFNLCHATAAQKAEAFLETIKKYPLNEKNR